MFTFPTLRSTLFFMAVWAAFLAVAASVTSASAAMVLGGVLLGGLAGFAEFQAFRALPPGLSNSSADFRARRSGFLATLAGKAFLCAEVLCVVAVLAIALTQASLSALVLIPAFGLARHSFGLAVRLLYAQSERASEAQ